MLLKTDTFAPQRFEAEGCAEIRGKKVPYKTVCEDNVFYDDNGSAMASVFSYSYFRSDAENTDGRPVLFCFNGGPGSASVMVHIGFLGPVRVKYGEVDGAGVPLPPYETCNNDESLLDIADIVVIDAIGTGYGRLIDQTKADQFFGVEQDAEAVLTFVQTWLTRYGRWKSPKYIVGESYGCTRAACMIGMGLLGTDRAYSLAFDGAVLIGNTVMNGIRRSPRPVYPAVTLLPTVAAINWYHNHPSDQTCEEFAREAYEWGQKVYLQALFKGESMTAKEREAVIKKLMYYTGASRRYLEERDLEIEPTEIRAEIAAGKGLAVGRLDARVTRPLYGNAKAEGAKGRGLDDDAADDKYSPFFQGAFLGTVAPMLGIKTDRNFVDSRNLWASWKNEMTYRDTANSLSDVMRDNPNMKVLFMNGWYDLATTTGGLWYMLNHSHLPMDRVDVKYYETGHMVYLGEDKTDTVNRDIREFLTGEK